MENLFDLLQFRFLIRLGNLGDHLKTFKCLPYQGIFQGSCSVFGITEKSSIRSSHPQQIQSIADMNLPTIMFPTQNFNNPHDLLKTYLTPSVVIMWNFDYHNPRFIFFSLQGIITYVLETIKFLANDQCYIRILETAKLYANYLY